MAQDNNITNQPLFAHYIKDSEFGIGTVNQNGNWCSEKGDNAKTDISCFDFKGNQYFIKTFEGGVNINIVDATISPFSDYFLLSTYTGQYIKEVKLFKITGEEVSIQPYGRYTFGPNDLMYRFFGKQNGDINTYSLQRINLLTGEVFEYSVEINLNFAFFNGKSTSSIITSNGKFLIIQAENRYVVINLESGAYLTATIGDYEQYGHIIGDWMGRLIIAGDGKVTIHEISDNGYLNQVAEIKPNTGRVLSIGQWNGSLLIQGDWNSNYIYVYQSPDGRTNWNMVKQFNFEGQPWKYIPYSSRFITVNEGQYFWTDLTESRIERTEKSYTEYFAGCVPEDNNYLTGNDRFNVWAGSYRGIRAFGKDCTEYTMPAEFSDLDVTSAVIKDSTIYFISDNWPEQETVHTYNLTNPEFSCSITLDTDDNQLSLDKFSGQVYMHGDESGLWTVSYNCRIAEISTGNALSIYNDRILYYTENQNNHNGFIFEDHTLFPEYVFLEDGEVYIDKIFIEFTSNGIAVYNYDTSFDGFIMSGGWDTITWETSVFTFLTFHDHGQTVTIMTVDAYCINC